MIPMALPLSTTSTACFVFSMSATVDAAVFLPTMGKVTSTSTSSILRSNPYSKVTYVASNDSDVANSPVPFVKYRDLRKGSGLDYFPCISELVWEHKFKNLITIGKL